MPTLTHPQSPHTVPWPGTQLSTAGVTAGISCHRSVLAPPPHCLQEPHLEPFCPVRLSEPGGGVRSWTGNRKQHLPELEFLFFVPRAVLGTSSRCVSFNVVVTTPPEANVSMCTQQTRKRRLREGMRNAPATRRKSGEGFAWGPSGIGLTRGPWRHVPALARLLPSVLFSKPWTTPLPLPPWSLSQRTLAVTFRPSCPLPLHLPIPVFALAAPPFSRDDKNWAHWAHGVSEDSGGVRQGRGQRRLPSQWGSQGQTERQAHNALHFVS